MKKFLVVLCLFAALPLCAETIQMKDGNLITGSIMEQTEYVLKLNTSYGVITLNQREIEQILPDKHRVILKGGSQLIGQIVDLDEFNLKLKTDDGAIVNIDMPQIVSVETYDYDRGQNAQKEYVEKAQEKQAAQEAHQAAVAAGTAAAGVEAAGGLTFDSDIDQVFDTQKATVVNGQVVTPSATAQPLQAETPARPMTDEEAFLKGVKTGAVSQQEYAAAAKEELSAQKTKKEPKAEKKAPKLHNEADYNKYFAVQIGAMPMDLKLDNSKRAGFTGDKPYDVGGTSVAISGKFLWRIKGSRFWLGPELGFANIANNSFTDKDPEAASRPDPEVKTSGQILRGGATAHFYLNPKSRFAFYLTGSAMYEILHLNYRGEMQSERISSNGFAGAAGLGVETWIDDLMIGLEVREVFAQRHNELKKSSGANTLIQAQLSWKF